MLVVAISAALANSVAATLRVPCEVVKQRLQAGVYPSVGVAWAVLRERGEAQSAKLWKGVPLRSCQQRGRFVRAALRGALTGLAALHRATTLNNAQQAPDTLA